MSKFVRKKWRKQAQLRKLFCFDLFEHYTKNFYVDNVNINMK